MIGEQLLERLSREGAVVHLLASRARARAHEVVRDELVEVLAQAGLRGRVEAGARLLVELGEREARGARRACF